MKHHSNRTVRAFAFVLIAVVGLLGPTSGLNALPSQGSGMKIPVDKDKAAMKRGRNTAMDYRDNYGDLSISVQAVGTGGVKTDLVEAINAEIASQFTAYTGREIDVIQPEFGAERVERILARQNKVGQGPGQNPREKAEGAIIREMTQMSNAPYLLAFFVGGGSVNGKDAGIIVTIRFIEVATGRELFQISDQFWQDSRRYPNVPISAWVQHSVTYWMNEIFDEDELNFPGAFNRFRAPIEFFGDVPDNAWLRQAIAEATGISKNKINPRRMRADGIDKVSLTLSLDAPPHTVMDELIQNIQDAFATKNLDARPLSQDGGSIFFAVSSVPIWYAVSDKKDNAFKESFTKEYQKIGSPNIAVLTYGAAHVDWRLWGGDATPIGTACEGILTDLNASVVGVGTIKKNFADIRSGARNGRYGVAVRNAMPDELRERAQWVLMIEVVPAYRDRQGYRIVATARLIDLQQDRVVAAAIFPSDDSVVPDGEAKLEPLTHAARYLTGSVARTMMKRLKAGVPPKVLDVVIENAPSFEFVNRIDSIVNAREQVVSTKLPNWNKDGGRYSFEALYIGDSKAMHERLRADLGTLPLKIKGMDSGKITLVYDEEAAAP